MGTGTLTIDLDALTHNWRALDRLNSGETGVSIKADAYGLGVGRVARRLAHAGARTFFVAVAEEGAALREALGPGPEIFVFSGHMPGDGDMIRDLGLTPVTLYRIFCDQPQIINADGLELGTADYKASALKSPVLN